MAATSLYDRVSNALAQNIRQEEEARRTLEDAADARSRAHEDYRAADLRHQQLKTSTGPYLQSIQTRREALGGLLALDNADLNNR
jgi:hypothetical protein